MSCEIIVYVTIWTKIQNGRSSTHLRPLGDANCNITMMCLLFKFPIFNESYFILAHVENDIIK